MKRLTATTPAGTVVTVQDRDNAEFPILCAARSHAGVQIINARLSYNAAWALSRALSEFFGDRPGECTLDIEEG